jgi:hypothetical protein
VSMYVNVSLRMPAYAYICPWMPLYDYVCLRMSICMSIYTTHVSVPVCMRVCMNGCMDGCVDRCGTVLEGIVNQCMARLCCVVLSSITHYFVLLSVMLCCAVLCCVVCLLYSIYAMLHNYVLGCVTCYVTLYCVVFSLFFTFSSLIIYVIYATVNPLCCSCESPWFCSARGNGHWIKICHRGHWPHGPMGTAPHTRISRLARRKR